MIHFSELEKIAKSSRVFKRFLVCNKREQKRFKNIGQISTKTISRVEFTKCASKYCKYSMNAFGNV